MVQPGPTQNGEAVLAELPFTTCPGRSAKLETGGHSKRATAEGLVASFPHPTHTLQILASYALKILIPSKKEVEEFPKVPPKCWEAALRRHV